MIMDFCNLSWKIVHSINGLSPNTKNNHDAVLSTFGTERLTIAKQLIEFNTRFSTIIYGQMSEADAQESGGLTHDEFLKVFRDGILIAGSSRWLR
jgi:phenol 2-monooxygenase